MKWKDLVKTALLGTDRTGLEATDIGQAEAAENPSKPDAAALLLQAGNMLLTQQKAGFPLVQIKDNLFPSIASSTVPLSSKAALYLERVFSGPHQNAIKETINLLTIHQKILPTYLLPDLMAKVQDKDIAWTTVQPMLDQRAYWLIQQHPEWKSFDYSHISSDWKNGTADEKTRYFKTFRQINPEEAITWLEEKIESETAKTRLALLAVLKEDLNEKDLPFLSDLTNFSQKEVRRQAALMLTQFPQANLYQELINYLDQFIVASKKQLIDIKERITFPTEQLKEFKHLGLQKNKSKYTSNAQKGWLAQIISLVNPNYLESRFELSPAKILSQLKGSHNFFIQAITEATIMHRNKLWAEALISFWLSQSQLGFWKTTYTNELLNIIDNKAFNRIIVQFLSNQNYLMEEHDSIFRLLLASDHEWEIQLAKWVIEPLQRALAQSSVMSWSTWHYAKILEKAAYTFNPNVVNQLQYGWTFQSRSAYQWEEVVKKFNQTLLFRKNLRQVLEKEA